MNADLAVIIVTYNSAEVIEGLLDSLPDALQDIAADVVVVDNGSTDDTRQVLARRGDCIVVADENRGYAAGINRGAQERPHAEAYLVLNADVRLAPGAVGLLLETLALPDTGLAAPRVVGPHGQLDLSLRREPSVRRALGLGRSGLRSLSEYVTDRDEYAVPQVVAWAMGAVLLVSGACHRRLGGWDESFFLYSEETDFCLRARDLGYCTRYDPRAVAVHIGGQSGRDDRTHAMQIVNRVRLFERRNSQPASTVYWALTLLSEVSWILRGHTQSRAAVRALLRRPRRGHPGADGRHDR